MLVVRPGRQVLAAPGVGRLAARSNLTPTDRERQAEPYGAARAEGQPASQTFGRNTWVLARLKPPSGNLTLQWSAPRRCYRFRLLFSTICRVWLSSN